MKTIKILMLMLISVSTYSQTQNVGSAGVSTVDQDPDNITLLQTINKDNETTLAWDYLNQKLYVADPNAALNSRWSDYSTLLPTAVNSNERLDNPHIVGTNLVFDIIDIINGNAITGTQTIPLTSISPVQDVQVGSGLSVSSAGGVFTITNTQTGESTTVSDSDNIDLTLTGTDVSGTVKLDPAGDNAITTSAAGLKTVVPANLDNDPANENQTVTGGSGITVTQTGQTFDVSNDEISQGVYKSIADAVAGGVLVGQYFTAANGNKMGATPGQKIKILP